MALIPVQPPGALVELPTPSHDAQRSARQLPITEEQLGTTVVPIDVHGTPLALQPRVLGDIVCAIADSTSGATIEQVIPYLRGMGTELCAVMYQTLGNVIGHFMMTQVSRMEALSEDHKSFLTYTAGLMTSYMQQDGHQNREAVIASVQYGHDMIQRALAAHNKDNKENHGALVALHAGIDRQLVEQNVSRDAQFANLNTTLASCFRAVSHKIDGSTPAVRERGPG